jgi:hypothetical protein
MLTPLSDEIDWRHLCYDDFLELISTEQKAFQFACARNLIDRIKTCTCGQPMNLHQKNDQPHGVQFICSGPRSVCFKNKSVLSNTWFARSKLTVATGFKAIAGYAAELTNSQLSFFLGTVHSLNL